MKTVMDLKPESVVAVDASVAEPVAKSFKITPIMLIEWGGALLGVAGSEVLARNASYSRYGWIIWIASNILWIAFALKRRAFGLLAMQIFYMGISIQGAVNWLR